MGDLLGNAVCFGAPDDDVLVAGEGIETMLSLRCALPTLPMAAALSANHLAAMLLSSSLRRLEPRVAQGSDQGVENIGDGTGDHLALWQGSRIGLVVEWTVAKELQFVEDEVGRRWRVLFGVVMVAHRERSFAGLAAPIAAFVAITQTASGTGQNPKAQRRAEAPAEDGGGRLFCFAMQRPAGPAENSRS
jgi:hypothetical protein